MNPRFSVIIPLYNKAPYVKKALESVVSQTYRDFELIIVDDGSADNSVAICEEYFNSFTPSFVHSLIRQKNAGVAAARNNGVAASHGEYLCFLDADDWWKAEYLEEMDMLITEYPDAGLYATNFVYYKPGKTRIEHQNVRTGYINYPEVYYRTGSMPVWTGAACMSRNVFDKMGGFPEWIKLGEDFLLWAKIAVHYKVAFCEKPLASYNNDVPPSLRATRNLYPPEFNMLFNMKPIEEEIEQYVDSGKCKEDWKALLDWLRVNGLMEYWMDSRYHGAAVVELAKVEWTKQPEYQINEYKTPLWIMKMKREFMRIGSYFKQRLFKMFYV